MKRLDEDPSEDLHLEDMVFPDPPEPDPNEPESIEEAAKVVLRLVYEFCGTHPSFHFTPKEKASFDYLADEYGVEWTFPAITSR